MTTTADILRLPPPAAMRQFRVGAPSHESAAAYPEAESAVQDALRIARPAPQSATWLEAGVHAGARDLPAFLAQIFVQGRNWTDAQMDTRLYGNPAALAYQATDRLFERGVEPLFDLTA